MKTFVYRNDDRVLTATWVVGSQYIEWGSTTDYDEEAEQWRRSDYLAVFNVIDDKGGRMLSECSTPEDFRAHVDERWLLLDSAGPGEGSVHVHDWPPAPAEADG